MKTERIYENLTPSEVLAIRQQERAAGRLVDVHRFSDNLVEIVITHPDIDSRIIDITPKRDLFGNLLG